MFLCFFVSLGAILIVHENGPPKRRWQAMKYMMDTDDVANKLKANFTVVAVVVKVGGSHACLLPAGALAFGAPSCF